MKQGKRRFNWFLLLLIFVVGYFSYTAVEQCIYLKAIAAEREAAEARLSEAQRTNEELKQEKQSLAEPEYIEKIAREELGMTKQGEMPYISSKK